MITADDFIDMRAPDGEAIELALDNAIAEAARQGKLDVEVKVDPGWRALEQVLRAYRRAGWKITHYTSGLDVVLKLEVR